MTLHRRRAPALLLLLAGAALLLLAAAVPRAAGGFAGGLGGFGSLSELSELPEDVFEDEPTITGKDILAGASSFPSKGNGKNKKRGASAAHTPAATAAATAAPAPASVSGGFKLGAGSHPKAEAAWRAVRATAAKAFLPSLATAAAGAAVTTLQRRYGGKVVRLLAEQRERVRLRREKGRLEREIRREQQRYEKEMRGMMEEAAVAQQRLEGEEGVEEEQEEERAAEAEEEMEQEREQQEAPQQRPPGLDLRAYVSQLEGKVEALKAEVVARGEQAARTRTAGQEEIASARSMVDQLRRELDGTRLSRAQLQEQLEGVKREYQARVAAVKEEATAAGVSEEERARIRAEAEGEVRGEMERAVAQAREQAGKEARHRALADVRERVQQEKAKYEAEIVELYRRRLKEEVAKRDALLEQRLHSQDVEYRRQCEELRVKVQQLMRDRDAQMRAKVAAHARGWQAAKSQGQPQPQQQKKGQQGRYQPEAAPQQMHEGGGGDAAAAWQQQQQPEPAAPIANEQRQQPRMARRGAAAGRGRYPAPGMGARRERV